MSSISSIYTTLSNGLSSASQRLATTSQKAAEFGSGTPGSEDLAGNLVDLTTEQITYDANGKALKMADLMLATIGNVLDTGLRA